MDTPLFRPGLTSRLFLVLFGLGAGLVLAMALATRYSVQTGMVRYLGEIEMERLEPLARRLETGYREHGTWDFVAANRRAWLTLLVQNLDMEIGGGERGARPVPPPEGQTPPPEAPREAGPDRGEAMHEARPRWHRLPDPSGLPVRVRLLDANRRPLIGPPDFAREELTLRPLTVDRQVVGYLALMPSPLVQDGLEERFLHRQMLMLLGIAALGLGVSVVVAVLFGRALGRPILHLADVVRGLAGGALGRRASLAREDELGALARDLNQLGEALERNEKLRREAMADVSHELRTPIALLRANIEAMTDGVLPTDSRQLGQLHAAVLRLSRLVDDLYDMALVDAGAQHYQRENLDLSELVRGALDAAAPGLAAAGLSLRSAIAAELRVSGDWRRLRQVVDNLLENSRRYTDTGGEVSVRLVREPGCLRLSVEDSAPGVPEAALTQLFQRFFRVEASRSRASGGAGLGLAIVKTLVEAHGGRVEAGHSELGGLRITVILPEA